MVSHGAISMNRRLSLSISPQEGVGGWVPSPRKLRPASTWMAVERKNVACTITGESTLGNMKKNMMLRSLAPTERTASMYSSCLTAITLPRVTLAMRVLYMNPMVISRFIVFGPNIAIMTSASRITGNA